MKEHSGTEKGNRFMLKLARGIVDKRKLIFLFTLLLLIFSVFSSDWVKVENALEAYLPEDSETRQGLDVMQEQFTTFGTARLMFANVTLEEAQAICRGMEETDGIQSVEFDETREHYNNACALYTVTFDYDEDDDRCLEVLDGLTETWADYDVYVSSELGDTKAEALDAEVRSIMGIVAVVVVSVLILTSQTYAEVPVLILTFLAAMLINKGTDFLLGEISFVSNSVTGILQLALSLDYAVILCNRFKVEHEALPAREAVIVALSKAIPEISASSLTTIGGLFAMMFMQFEIGPDMAISLIKSILMSLLSVFLLMPGLLVLFAPMMDKSRHRSFVPQIPFVGKFAYATRFVVPVVFLGVTIAAAVVSANCPYAYGEDNIPTPKQNETQVAKQMIRENFTDENMVALVVPSGSYETEGEILRRLETYEEVDYTVGLSNVEAMDGYMLADELGPRQFSELTDIDYELAKLLYTAYAADQEDYGRIVGDISNYTVPLMDLFLFVYDCTQDGYVTLDAKQQADLDEAYDQIHNAKLQLSGEDYSRMLVYLTLPLGSETTYEFLDTIREIAKEYYPQGNVYVVGNATTEYDFQKSFSRDNTVVSIVSILIVLVVLLFTFKSIGIPFLLILVIQGSIWMNFSIPAITGREIFFMSYLIVSSIQMGANIDYAIVIGSRFMEVKDEMPKRGAIINTMNFAFPTIVTSGTIMATAGILIGRMTSSPSIAGVGSIGRGTVISMILVMFVLPQILLLGEKLIDKTSFSIRTGVRRQNASGRVRVDGVVHGEISGRIYGVVHAIVEGDVDVRVISGSALEEGGEDREMRQEE